MLFIKRGQWSEKFGLAISNNKKQALIPIVIGGIGVVETNEQQCYISKLKKKNIWERGYFSLTSNYRHHSYLLMRADY